MIRVTSTRGVFSRPGELLRHRSFPDGMTVSEILEHYPKGFDLVIGGRIEEDGGRELRNASALAAPRAAAGFEGFFLTLALTLVTRLGEEQGWWGKRSSPSTIGDTESPSYAWDGVHTSIGPGHILPTIWGEAVTGGQVIFGSVEVQNFTSEYLHTLIALGEGRIYGVGGIVAARGTGDSGQLGRCSTLGYTVRANNLPSDVYINEAKIDPAQDDDLMMFLRLGSLEQRPLHGTPYTNPAATAVVPFPTTLHTVGDSQAYTISTSEVVSRVTFTIQWPDGCYVIQPNGGILPIPIAFVFSYRLSGSSVWIASDKQVVEPPARRGSTSWQFTINLGQGVRGPIETRVERVERRNGVPPQATPPHWVTDAIVRQITWAYPVTLAYPKTAYVGVTQVATEITQGRIPQYRFRVKGRMVRTWDENLGWSGYVWSVNDFASVDPDFDGIWSNDPGRNPAWLCLEYLLASDGLGTFIRSSTVDLQSFRDWADYCDGDLGDGAPAGTPRFQVGYVKDRVTASWEFVQLLARAGRGRVLLLGSQVIADYDYSDAHGRGTNSVPAKVATMVLADSNCREFHMSYLPIDDRPTVFQFTFRNAAKEFERDTISVEDPSADLNSPYKLTSRNYILQTHDRDEVTSEAQLRRDGLMMHRANRLRYACEAVAHIDTITVTVGDVILVQSDVIRPYTDPAPKGWRISRDITSEDVVALDHAVTLEAGKTYAVQVVKPDQSLELVTITQAAGTYARGADLSITPATNLTVDAGAVCVFGETSKLTIPMQVRAITLAGTMHRKLSMIEWDPSVYEDIYSAPTEGSSDLLNTLSQGHTIRRNPELLLEPGISSAKVTPGERSGGHRLLWELADRPNAPVVRIYRRSGNVPESSHDANPNTPGEYVPGPIPNPWVPIAEVRGFEYEVHGLAIGDLVEFSLCVGDGAGRFQGAESGYRLTYRVEEFPDIRPPNGPTIAVTTSSAGVNVTWSRANLGTGHEYELRLGPFWPTARVLYRGPDTRFLHMNAPRSSSIYTVRVVGPSGLGSQEFRSVAGPAWIPEGTAVDTENVELPSGSAALGTLSDVTYDQTTQELRIADGKYQGTYTSSELDMTTAVLRWWWQTIESRSEDGVPVDEDTEPVSGGDALWGFVEDAEPSIENQGIDLWTTVDEDTATVDTVDDEPGDLGGFVAYKHEVRYHDGATWGDWREVVGGEFKTARKAQVRVRMSRSELRRQLYVSLVNVGATDEVSTGAAAATLPGFNVGAS